jgi:hypothetical protein
MGNDAGKVVRSLSRWVTDDSCWTGVNAIVLEDVHNQAYWTYFCFVVGVWC